MLYRTSISNADTSKRRCEQGDSWWDLRPATQYSIYAGIRLRTNQPSAACHHKTGRKIFYFLGARVVPSRESEYHNTNGDNRRLSCYNRQVQGLTATHLRLIFGSSLGPPSSSSGPVGSAPIVFDRAHIALCECLLPNEALAIYSGTIYRHPVWS